jgi:hypothetical protein
VSHQTDSGQTTVSKPGTVGAVDFDSMFSIQRLRKTANQLRTYVRQVRARDVIDWVDWFIALHASLPLLREELLSGEYQPLPATRYEWGKAQGGFRVISSFNLRDALVFRHICDFVLERARPSQAPGVYFSRRYSSPPVGQAKIMGDEDPYLDFLAVWLRYNQYRSKTLLSSPHEVLVVTDISNFFDSIHHELLLEYLAPLGIPRKAVALLGRLLDAFKTPAGHSPNPRTGIPTDEFDCSRQLAHVFLFEHDWRVLERVGTERYVRWMDDQNLGVGGATEARRMVNAMTHSLGSLRLTLNTAKTRFLTPDEVVIHFQLDANELLDAWPARIKSAGPDGLGAIRDQFDNDMQDLLSGPTAGRGNWDKILKRMYGLAAQLESPLLEPRALDDLIAYPDLDERIFRYFAIRNRGAELLTLFRQYLDDGESLFEATEAACFDALLTLDPDSWVEIEVRGLARAFIRDELTLGSGRPLSRAAAMVVLYWFDEEDLPHMFTDRYARALPKEVARAWMACATAQAPEELDSVRAALFGHPSDDLARLSQFLDDLHEGRLPSLGNYKKQKSRWPAKGFYYDARSWLGSVFNEHA